MEPNRSTAEQIGATLAVRRRELNLTQADAADLAGIAQRSVSSIETGKLTTRLDSIVALADALGLTVSITTKAPR